jgi:hypothetical protein
MAGSFFWFLIHMPLPESYTSVESGNLRRSVLKRHDRQCNSLLFGVSFGFYVLRCSGLGFWIFSPMDCAFVGTRWAPGFYSDCVVVNHTARKARQKASFLLQ